MKTVLYLEKNALGTIANGLLDPSWLILHVRTATQTLLQLLKGSTSYNSDLFYLKCSVQ